MFEQNMKQPNQKIIEDEYAEIASIHHFAQMTAQIILDSTVMRRATPSTEHGVDYHPDNICSQTDLGEAVTMSNHIEMLAEEVTLQACCKALEEIGGHCVLRCDDSSKDKHNKVMEGVFVPCSSGYTGDEDASEMETDTNMEEYNHKLSTSGYATSLKSMVNLGSIEYPDAPPSTPLIPEMLKSRDSFSRKLKGGLAKEFLPSPPPPTPKDPMLPLLENPTTDTPTDKSDFMMRLMRSLSLECGKQGGQKEQKAGDLIDGGLQNDIPMLFEYASQLSADILHFITTDNIGGNKPVCAIAEQLANEIVKTSLADVMTREDEKIRDQNGHKSVTVDRDKLSAADDIKVLASELIFNAVVHAFTKLKHGTHPHLLGQATEQQPWEKERYSNTHFCKDSTHPNKATAVSCGNDTLEFNVIKSVKMTSSVHTYANNFAEGVLDNAMRDASSLQVHFRQTMGTRVKNGSVTCVMEMHAEESRDVQELKCALLWAAASLKGASELYFDLPDRSLKQKVRISMLSLTRRDTSIIA